LSGGNDLQNCIRFLAGTIAPADERSCDLLELSGSRVEGWSK
jgi:hypothetical protein